MQSKELLVGDIGGTNARFALTAPGETGYRQEQVLQCADYPDAETAVAHYLQGVGSPVPAVICFALAGPVQDGAVDLTNNHWFLQEQALAKRFSAADVKLLNDFEAIACCLPSLGQDDTRTLGPLPVSYGRDGDVTLAVMGPGTGLGAASLLRRSGEEIPLVSEAGHVGFAPETAAQRTLLDTLSTRFPRISNERLLSGEGVVNLYNALAEQQAATPRIETAAEVFEVEESDTIAAETVSLFFEILGQAAGNFALSTGAFNGVYVAGGIAQRHADRLLCSGFRQGFENKGRHRPIMEAIPTALITHPHPGLLGAATVAPGAGDTNRLIA